jgi:hypothetical protein
VLEEFCQAPLCLELDLDTYEGDWTHVARFRGRSGWVIGARATLQSVTDIYRTVIVAGCDEAENPIPAFQASHLLECTWSNLAPCFEHPPEILDDLLCEEEGQVYGRWQRETNVALQRHLVATDDRIAAIERAARRDTDLRLRQMDDLRRRRRAADSSDDARAIFDAVIADLDAENDRAFEANYLRVRSMRAEADEIEESLWRREDVLIEVEPLCCVQWSARPTNRQTGPPRSGASLMTFIPDRRPFRDRVSGSEVTAAAPLSEPMASPQPLANLPQSRSPHKLEVERAAVAKELSKIADDRARFMIGSAPYQRRQRDHDRLILRIANLDGLIAMVKAGA